MGVAAGDAHAARVRRTHEIGAELPGAVQAFAERLAAKPFRPMAEMKARINTLARAGLPEVNAMTEGFLERS